MKEKEIINGNILIAEFIGGKFHKATEGHEESDEFYFPKGMIDIYDHQRASDNLQFHRSWDWLMPVLEKIAQTKGKWVGHKPLVKITIYRDSYCRIENTSKGFRNGIKPDTLIIATWKTVVDFLKWHNE